MPYLSLPGERLFYAPFEGDLHRRRNVILVHGAGGNHRHWPASLRRLSGYRVLCLDLPGHGLSSGHGRTSVAEYALSVDSFVRGLNLAHTVVIGHSMGGAIALTLALQSLPWLSAIVVIACGPRLPIASQFLNGLQPIPQNETIRRQTIHQICRQAYGPDASPQLQQRGCQELLNVDPEVLYADYLACSRFDVSHRLNRIRVPALSLTGDLDKMLPGTASREVENQIPGVQAIAMPGTGHMLVLEKPQQTAVCVKDFLNGLPHSAP